MKKIISTEKAPQAIGPYSQAVMAGGLLFISGQLGMDPVTGEFAGASAAEQAVRALENMKAILEAAGLTMGHVIKTTVLLKDIGDFAAVNEVYARYFSAPFPARAAYAAAALPRNAMVEIEGVAITS